MTFLKRMETRYS